MSSLAIAMQTTSASFAMGDEWDGIAPLMPDAADAGSSYQVGKMFAKVGAQGAVGQNAQALVMAAGAGGPASKLASWQSHSYPQLNAAMLAACRSTLQRKRLASERVVLATPSEPGDAATTWDVLALRSAGFAAPLCIPRALACAAAMPPRDAPLGVIEIGFEDVWVSEVRYDGGSVDSALVTRRGGIGFSAIWKPLLSQLEDRFCAAIPNADVARCEAVEFARALIAHSLNSHGALTPVPRLREDGGVMKLEAVFACGLRASIEHWCKQICEAIAPTLGNYRQAVVTVEDCGVARLSQFVIAQLQQHLACDLIEGIDAAQGALRIAASGAPLPALSQRHARVSQFRDMSFGVLRPDGAGGASFHPLGQVGQLTAPQKLSLKTTREDQARMVLPLGLCAPNASPQMLGILEFPLSAPAKKGVLVEFYIELADPLIRVCGIEEQGISPVGEVFVPLDPSLAQEAASLREFVSVMGTVY